MNEMILQASHGMRGVASPMCGNGFPIGGNGANGFMGPMHYNKHIHLAPHEQPYLQVIAPRTRKQHTLLYTTRISFFMRLFFSYSCRRIQWRSCSIRLKCGTITRAQVQCVLQQVGKYF